jgi:hypothetical protein
MDIYITLSVSQIYERLRAVVYCCPVKPIEAGTVLKGNANKLALIHGA